MKRFITSVLCLSVFAFCHSNTNNNEKGNSENGPGDKTVNEKKITKRDRSITKSNSYSDLFLDSMDVENFIAQNKLSDSVSRRMRSFYNARNFQFAWFSSDGPTEQGRSFWNLHEYYTTYSKDNTLDDKNLKKKMNLLVSEETPHLGGKEKAITSTEITLTQHFIQYVFNNYHHGEIKRKEMERFVPFKKAEAMYLADSLLTKKHKDNKYYTDVNPAYKLLYTQLQKYHDIVKKGGWQTITPSIKSIKKGTSSPVVLEIKKRLQITGELAAADTSQLFDDQLDEAVKKFQLSRGLTQTGVVNAAVVKEMNVPAIKRLEQILLNMGRMRWMLNAFEGGNLITVNIPEFVLHVYEGKSKAFDMNVVVGKEGHNTTIFTGNLNQVVFSPYWNVTPNIVKTEVLPAMAKDPDYLTRNNMEEVGSPVDGIPTIRQLPGPKNSLGKVKFLFPNSYDIYFHDTPAKSLFSSDKRAFSHGCIRLSDPEKMANYVLRNQSEWTPERISEAMDSGQEQFVRVKNPIPVLITYYTVWVDENGILNFRDDIYGHDANLIEKMFTNPM